MSLFGRASAEATAALPGVAMVPPAGGGTFVVGARHYLVARGSTFKAHAEDVPELQAQGCLVVLPPAALRELSREEVRANYEATERASHRPAVGPLVRVIPPLWHRPQSLTVEGRAYLVGDGRAQDVPQSDAAVLVANGWLRVGRVGSSDARPLPIQTGEVYFDLDLNRAVICDGCAWRDLATGLCS